jgi:hypothetical protein
MDAEQLENRQQHALGRNVRGMNASTAIAT